jgi:uncharacterized membrane protein
MKKYLIISGGITTIAGLLQIVRSMLLHRVLNEFDTGYLVGSVLLAIIGVVLIITGRKIVKKK